MLKANDSDLVPVIPDKPRPLGLDESASYLLVGGLGGLGRSIARWMVSRGARHFIFISRSGAASDAAQELVKELEATECRAFVFSCDISDKSALLKIVEYCKATLPPIKGCAGLYGAEGQ